MKNEKVKQSKRFDRKHFEDSAKEFKFDFSTKKIQKQNFNAFLVVKTKVWMNFEQKEKEFQLQIMQIFLKKQITKWQEKRIRVCGGKLSKGQVLVFSLFIKRTLNKRPT